MVTEVYLKNFFALYFGSRRARTRGPILTIYTSYDVLPPKDVPFGVLFVLLPISQDGGRPPSLIGFTRVGITHEE